jgi:hypothetical protein
MGLPFEELTRCALFNYFAQPHKLICALIWLHVTPTFKIVHRRSADRARNYLALIKHRELQDHSIEVETLDLASLQRHCKCSMLRDFIVPRKGPPMSVDRPSHGGPTAQSSSCQLLAPIEARFIT